MDFPKQEYWSGLPLSSWRIFPTQGLNLHLLLSRWILYHYDTCGSDSKASCLQCRRPGFNPWVGKIPWRRKWQSTPVLLPGKSHGRRSLVGYSPWGQKELDTTERLHFHFALSMTPGKPLLHLQPNLRLDLSDLLTQLQACSFFLLGSPMRE